MEAQIANVALELPTTISDLDLSLEIKCQFGHHNILDYMKCALECSHTAHKTEGDCQHPAEREQRYFCHGERMFLCNQHSAHVKNQISLAQASAARDGEDVICFHCDGIHQVEFRRL